MWEWTLPISLLSSIVTILFCLWLALRQPKTKHNASSYKTMVVLGSGGHTSEMFKFMETLPVTRKYTPRVYVIANSDTGSEATMTEFEASKTPSAKSPRSRNAHKAEKEARFKIRCIPRSRVVGQSYFTSIFTTLYSFVHCAMVVWQERPTVLLANGPGTCLPILFCAWLYRSLGLAPCTIMLLESYACVQHESLTGKLCKRIVDRYCVQWPTLLNDKLPHVVYTGRVPRHAFENAPKNPKVIGEPSSSYVLVTVGSTLFNSLITAIDNMKFVDLLKKSGFSGLHVQYGNGVAPKTLNSVPGFEITAYSYKKTGWKDEMANASLVIGHAGAGTILDSLEASKPIIVVANDLLMSQHQTEIAQMMEQLGHLFSSTPSKLMQDLPRLLPRLSSLREFPKQETKEFANVLLQFLNQGQVPDLPDSIPSNVRKTRSSAH